MANSYDVSQARERHEDIGRKIQADRSGRGLRKDGMDHHEELSKIQSVARIKGQVFRGIAFLGKAALFCTGVSAVLALAIVIAILVPVVLVANILPAAVVGLKRNQSVERYAGNALEVSAPLEAAATSRQQAW
jgi:hypothetical protein